jgi:hypothetical protein
MEDKIQQNPFTYILLAVTLYVLIFLHIFGLATLRTDKFAFFLVSMLFVLLLIPYLKYIKVFDFVEIRKEVKMLKQDIERMSSTKIQSKKR